MSPADVEGTEGTKLGRDVGGHVDDLPPQTTARQWESPRGLGGYALG